MRKEIGSVDTANTSLFAMQPDYYVDLNIHNKIKRTYGPFPAEKAYKFFLYELNDEAKKISSQRYLLITSILYKYVKSKKYVLVKKNLTGFYNDLRPL